MTETVATATRPAGPLPTSVILHLPPAMRKPARLPPLPQSLSTRCAALETAARQSGRDHLGLDLGERDAAAWLGPLWDMAMSAPSLGTALERLTAFFPSLQPDTRCALQIEAGSVRLEYRILDGRILERRQDADFALAALLTLLRRCLGPAWAPEEIHFEHPQPAETARHRRIFRAPLCFSMESNALVFRRADLVHPMPARDAGHFQDRQNRLRAPGPGAEPLTLTDAVRGEIRARLAAGYPRIEDVAEALRLPRWTLQRRLADQGQVFSALVENTRRSLAEMHLGAAHMPIQDIAGVLGYSELSAFTRASVRWFGKPPSRMRDAILRDRAAQAA